MRNMILSSGRKACKSALSDSCILAAAERVFQEYALRDYIDTLVMYCLVCICDVHVQIII